MQAMLGQQKPGGVQANPYAAYMMQQHAAVAAVTAAAHAQAQMAQQRQIVEKSAAQQRLVIAQAQKLEQNQLEAAVAAALASARCQGVLPQTSLHNTSLLSAARSVSIAGKPRRGRPPSATYTDQPAGGLLRYQHEGKPKLGRPLKNPLSTPGAADLSLLTAGLLSAQDAWGMQCRGPAKAEHQCAHCMKNFVSQSKLARHMLVHTKEKPWVCGTCGTHFSQKSALTVHTKRTLATNKSCASKRSIQRF